MREKIDTGEYILAGDRVLNPETGEIVGFVNPYGDPVALTEEDYGTDSPGAAPRFMIMDDAGAEWYLRKRMELEGAIYDNQRRAAIIAANMERERVGLERNLHWLDLRFEGELKIYAKMVFQNKERSRVTPFGTFGFRRTQGAIKIADSDAALRWAKIACPEAVRTSTKESLVVTPLKGLEESLPSCFLVEQPGEKFYIKSGLEKKDAPNGS